MPFNNMSNEEMIAKSATVAAAFTPEMYAHIISLLLTPESYRELHDRYEASFTASLKGGADEAKECEAHRIALNQGMAILNGMAKVATIKDPTVPERLRLQQEKPSSVTTDLIAPQNVKAVYDPKGRLTCSFSKVGHAKLYEIWGCDGDPSLEENWKLLTTTTTCRMIVLNGLDRTKKNWLRARAKGSHEIGPWSNCISLDPL